MRIGIDVMGGDNAPDEILKGCFAALANLAADDQLVLIGDAGLINEAIAERGIKSTHIEVVGTTEVIGMDESPSMRCARRRFVARDHGQNGIAQVAKSTRCDYFCG